MLSCHLCSICPATPLEIGERIVRTEIDLRDYPDFSTIHGAHVYTLYNPEWYSLNLYQIQKEYIVKRIRMYSDYNI